MTELGENGVEDDAAIRIIFDTKNFRLRAGDGAALAAAVSSSSTGATGNSAEK